MDEENNLKLFEWIYDTIRKEGGDGDCVVGFTHQNYKIVADSFEMFLKTKLGSWTKVDNETDITFYDHQEYFCFTDKQNFNSVTNYGPRILTW
jgi:hypothetical protein